MSDKILLHQKMYILKFALCFCVVFGSFFLQSVIAQTIKQEIEYDSSRTNPLSQGSIQALPRPSFELTKQQLQKLIKVDQKKYFNRDEFDYNGVDPVDIYRLIQFENAHQQEISELVRDSMYFDTNFKNFNKKFDFERLNEYNDYLNKKIIYSCRFYATYYLRQKNYTILKLYNEFMDQIKYSTVWDISRTHPRKILSDPRAIAIVIWGYGDYDKKHNEDKNIHSPPQAYTFYLPKDKNQLDEFCKNHIKYLVRRQ